MQVVVVGGCYFKIVDVPIGPFVLLIFYFFKVGAVVLIGAVIVSFFVVVGLVFGLDFR